MRNETLFASDMPRLINKGDIITDAKENRTFTVTGKPELIRSGFISVKGIPHNGKPGEKYFDFFPEDSVKVSYVEPEEEVYA